MAKPAYRAYTVVKRENKDDSWLNIGVCFAHEDKDGFNLLLQAPALLRPCRQRLLGIGDQLAHVVGAAEQRAPANLPGVR